MTSAAAAAPDRAGISILVADGTAFGRDFARLSLRRAGFGRVVPVADGAAAAEALGSVRPDIVVLDWDLGLLPAPEVLRLARGGEGDAPAIVVTMARPTRDAVEAARADGAESVLAKPVSAARLRSHVAAALARAGRSFG